MRIMNILPVGKYIFGIKQVNWILGNTSLEWLSACYHLASLVKSSNFIQLFAVYTTFPSEMCRNQFEIPEK